MSTTARRQATLAERVAARLDTLTATERRIAQYFAEHPQEVAFASAENLARAIGTSDASIIRTAKALGYDGLPGLKRTLQTQLEALLTPANRLHNSLDALTDGPEGVIAGILSERTEVLTAAGRTLNPASFAKAVKLIAGSRETVICGIAALGGLAEYFALRLTRIGQRARAATESGYQLADSLLPLERDDVLVVIAHHRVMREIAVALDHAREMRARIILLTDSLGEALDDQVDVVLSAPIGRPGMFSGQTTTLVVLEALTMAVAAHDRERSLAAITKMNQLRERLDGRPVDLEPLLGQGKRRASTRRK